MKIKQRICIILAIICQIGALLLEIIPKGVVLALAKPDGNPDLYTYNYFSGMPAAYAFTAPMLTGIATILLILLCVIWLLRLNNKMIGKVTAGVSLLSVLFSAGVVLLTEYSRNAVTFGVVALLAVAFALIMAACLIQKKGSTL